MTVWTVSCEGQILHIFADKAVAEDWVKSMTGPYTGRLEICVCFPLTKNPANRTQ